MTTTNERNFQRLIKEGMDRYQQAIDANSPKNRIRLANKCILKMKNAMKLSDLLELDDELGYVYEYVSLSQALIAEAYVELKDLKSAVHQFNKAKKSNMKTLKNEETYIRGCYIESKLLEIALLQQNWSVVDDLCQNIYKMVKKIDDYTRKIKYYRTIVSAFIKSKNISWLKKGYRKLVKVAKGLSDEDPEQLKEKAVIFYEYGEILKKVLNKKRKSRKYLEKAKEKFEAMNLIAYAKKAEDMMED